jgi:O-antigen/teichoic acid export membrane protein
MATTAMAKDASASIPGGSDGLLLRRGVWTLAGYGISQGVRFGSSVVLARLLAPQIFGVMVIVNVLRTGIELLTDVGVEQNIIHNEKGLEDEFFNTAWTVQMVRGALLTLLFLVVSSPVAHFYAIDVKTFLVVSLIPFVNSMHSTSVFALGKTLDVRRRNLFECGTELFGFVTCVVLALISPTIWALVGGALLATAMRSIVSYYLPHPPHRLILNRNCVREIVRFGRWIFLSSFAVYCASNIDRLTLGKLVPMALLGVYGMARTIAEIPATLAGRLGYQIVFPFLASQSGLKGNRAYHDLGAARLRISLGGALLISFAIAWADRAINIIYDPRYREAGWILSLLLFGTWFAILSNLNESVLLGCGCPSYGTFANGLRLVVVGTSLSFCYDAFGLEGAVVAMIAAELIRYSAIAFGQHRMRWSFYRQDALCTGVLLLAVGFWLFIRNSCGMGTPWDLVMDLHHGLLAQGTLR